MTIFEPITFNDACPSISYSFQIEKGDPHFCCKTLIVKFSGTYRDGSAGNPDARYMYGVLVTAVELWQPDALIIDFTEFEYSWGDMIEYAYNAAANIRFAIVVGPKCRRGLATLEFGLETKKDVTESNFYFDLITDAIDAIQEKA